MKALRYRVPEDAPEEVKDAAGEAFETVVGIMRGDGDALTAPTRLKAAAWVHLAVCGPAPQRLEHTGKDGEALTVSIEINRKVEK